MCHITNFKDFINIPASCDDTQITEHVRQLKYCLEGINEIPGFNYDEIVYMSEAITVQ